MSPPSSRGIHDGELGANLCLETATDPNILMPGPGDFASLQDIDWNSLVMDFDWTNNDMTYVP